MQGSPHIVSAIVAVIFLFIL